MLNVTKNHYSYLVFGDLACFLAGLLFALMIRSGGLPRLVTLELHLFPFAIIFIIWITIFYIAGLYDLRTIVFRDTTIRQLINAQLVNSGVVILIFYFFPAFIIAPKTVLLFDLVITLVLLFMWRSLYVKSAVKIDREEAFIVGKSQVAQELRDILEKMPHFGLSIVSGLSEYVGVIIVDFGDPNIESQMPELYRRVFSGVRFLNLQEVYEQVTGRIPPELISESWVLENVSLQPKPIYTFFKSAMDIIIALPLALTSLLYWPLIYLSNKIEDGGSLFSHQTRVGENDVPIHLLKLRTMSNPNDSGKWGNGNSNKTTKVGEFLRRSRLDEFPQLWNVVRGDLSLIGPRPEFPDPVGEYEQRIPYYKLRHIIKPGLSGWAQINQIENPHHSVDIELTRNKLSYDIYYIKNRSLFLDLKIALKTIKTLLSRVGA